MTLLRFRRFDSVSLLPKARYLWFFVAQRSTQRYSLDLYPGSVEKVSELFVWRTFRVVEELIRLFSFEVFPTLNVLTIFLQFWMHFRRDLLQNVSSVCVRKLFLEICNHRLNCVQFRLENMNIFFSLEIFFLI